MKKRKNYRQKDTKQRKEGLWETFVNEGYKEKEGEVKSNQSPERKQEGTFVFCVALSLVVMDIEFRCC